MLRYEFFLFLQPVPQSRLQKARQFYLPRLSLKISCDRNGIKSSRQRFRNQIITERLAINITKMVRIWEANFIHTRRSRKKSFHQSQVFRFILVTKNTEGGSRMIVLRSSLSGTVVTCLDNHHVYNTVFIIVSDPHSIWFPLRPQQLLGHRGTISHRKMRLSSAKNPDRLCGQHSLPVNWKRAKFAGLKRWGREGEPLPLHAFMACTETTLPFSTNAT